ncbi:uncharacterized protein CTRU02_204896 [Colletotrichum truncatum]|uniref:Uncharacterized protein n=1 Tax=Colletotrichum truncatum TaxID=5467 RepID=A0ACC3Z2H2_COLTU|nr:uncharacterized protein CTRU02_14045 [Colletotrichum truncatum]KAF6782726.1 hypothetical protein CTRU02_14045 [Colletotrichum truncatum]
MATKTVTNDAQMQLNAETAQKPSAPQKKSLYQRYKDSKRGEISEEDLVKYTGLTKAGLKEWAKDRPGVGGNQAAGKIDVGNTTGLGGMMAASGYGGWGPDSNAPNKFPPNKTNKN